MAQAQRQLAEADPFFVDLLTAPATPEAADDAARALRAVFLDPDQPLETRRHAAYYLAQVHEYRAEWNQMVQMLEFSGVTAGRDYDDYDFLAHQGWAHVFKLQQREAAHRGVPPIYINSMPHSGSSFVTAFTVAAFQIDRCRTTKGPFMWAQVVPAWLATFAHGGATTHEHFIATAVNTGRLEECGIAKLLVHVRHPVAALLSQFSAIAALGDKVLEFRLRGMNLGCSVADLRDHETGLYRYAKIFLPFLIEYMASWQSYSSRPDAKVKVHFSRYEDMVDDPQSFFRRLISILFGSNDDIDVARLVHKLQAETLATGAHNYRGGNSNALLDRYGDATKDAIAAVIPPDLLQFYGY